MFGYVRTTLRLREPLSERSAQRSGRNIRSRRDDPLAVPSHYVLLGIHLRTSFALVAISLLSCVAAACGSPDAPSTRSPVDSAPPTAPSSSYAPPSTTPTLAAPIEPSAEEASDTEPASDVDAESAEAQPYVVQCLFGTPGPAEWSDGTYAFSQWCFDQNGGDQYLQNEREANTFECDGNICSNPYTGMTYPDPSRAAVDNRVPTYETRSTNPGDYPAPTNLSSADGYGPGVELPPLCVRFPDTYKC